MDEGNESPRILVVYNHCYDDVIVVSS